MRPRGALRFARAGMRVGKMSDELNRFLKDIAEEEGYAEEEGEEETTEASEDRAAGAKGKTGARPDFRVLQPGVDRECNATYTEVGAMWKKTSRQGREFYQLKIGNLRLLVFPNK